MRKMRRTFQELTQAECVDILEKSTAGTLACIGDDSHPYAVPLSHVYADGKLYFHGALTGHRIDAVKHHPMVSYCVIGQDVIVPEELTTYYRSVIVFGRTRFVSDITEKRIALWKLAQKYAPDLKALAIEEIDRYIDTVSVMVIDIDNMTGKEALKLKQGRSQAQ